MTVTAPAAHDLQRIEQDLHAHALALPEAWEDFPWGERVVKVRRKVFLFKGFHDGALTLSMKLPQSGAFALDLPFTSPTGYGLGRAGWVSARFAPGDDVPMEVLRHWIGESYRAVAPRKLAALVPA